MRLWDKYEVLSLAVVGGNACIFEGLYSLENGGAQFDCRVGRGPSWFFEVVLCANKIILALYPPPKSMDTSDFLPRMLDSL
jgi:hypothetical protein